MYIIFFGVVLVFAISPFSAESAYCGDSSSSGREFMLALIETSDNEYNQFVTSININVFADMDGQLNVSIPFINLTDTYHLKDGGITISLNDTSIFASGNGTETKGILLESNVDVTVRVIIAGRASFDQEGFLALPVPERGGPSTYIASSWESALYSGEFLVASAADDTAVTITAFGEQHTVVLNKFDTYQMQFRSDPSGTIIHANGPVSVFAGSQCSSVLAGGVQGTCQYQVEQLIPVSNWGVSYITPALQSKHWNVIRVYTANDTATVTLSNSTSAWTLHMSSFDYTTIFYHDEPLWIQSDTPVQVIQYSTSMSDDYIGDTFMMTIPDVNNFQSTYKIKPLNVYTGDDSHHQLIYLTITIQQRHDTGLLLNRHRLAKISKHDVVDTYSPHGNYSVITIRLTNDVEYVLQHVKSGVTFGALLYGYSPSYPHIAYGYPLGMKFKYERCPTPAPTTSPVPTTQTETIQPGFGLTCMACDDMTHVGICDQVKRCHQHEICYLEEYTISEGKIRFRSGCTSRMTCPVEHSGPGSSGCKHCCTSNYCNMEGCGGTGLPALSSRGPMCYSCNHATTVEECDTVALCYPGQVCRILRFEWGGLYSHYQLGCSEQQMCLKRESSMAYRSTPSCHSCCTDDFCNTSCNNTDHAGVSLIG